MNPGSGLCQGCLRTIDEIPRWSASSPQAKRAIWASIAQRAAA